MKYQYWYQEFSILTFTKHDFRVKRSCFHHFINILRTISGIFLIFSMVVIYLKVLLVYGVFKYNLYCAGFWDCSSFGALKSTFLNISQKPFIQFFFFFGMVLDAFKIYKNSIFSIVLDVIKAFKIFHKSIFQKL